MKTKLLALAAFVLGAATSAQVLAHHSFAAEFDGNAKIDLHGVVTKVDWTNPHTYIYIEVENDAGEVEEWGMEMGSPKDRKSTRLNSSHLARSRMPSSA